METPDLPTAPRNEPTAIISLVASLAGACLVFPAIIGIICGHIARGKIRRSAGRLQGEGMALAGLILGYGTLFIFAVSLVLIVPIIGRVDSKAKQIQEISQLRQLSIAFYIYADKYDNQLPPDLATMMEEGIVTDGSLFVSPGSETPEPQTAADIRAGQCDYVYYPWQQNLQSFDKPEDVIIMHSKPGTFRDWLAVAFLDGHVVELPDLTIEEAARLHGWQLLDTTTAEPNQTP